MVYVNAGYCFKVFRRMRMLFLSLNVLANSLEAFKVIEQIKERQSKGVP